MSQANDVIAWATSQIGTREGRSGGHWNNQNPYAKIAGHANGYAWCATFVCAAFIKAGLRHLIETPSAGVDQLSVGFKKSNRWSQYPAVGAVVFYGKPSDLNHTGIVARYDSDHIWAIEGNTNDSGSREGDGVYLKKRERRSANVVGYGYPKYAEGIASADPAYARKPAPSKAPAKVKPTPNLDAMIKAGKRAKLPAVVKHLEAIRKKRQARK